MTPNLQKCKLQQTMRTVSSISKLMTSTISPPLSQHSFLAVQFHMHGCTILCAYLCWQSYLSKREMQTLLDICWMVWMNMCTGFWHTSARGYTLLAFVRSDTDAPTSAVIGTSHWFPSLGAWSYLWSWLAYANHFQRFFVIISYLSQVFT